MSKFQIAVIAIFAALIVLSVFIFAGYKGAGGEAVDITIWGTIPSLEFNKIIEKTPLFNSKLIKVSYAEKSSASFDSDLVEAIAAGAGPDLFMLPHDKIIKQKNKIIVIPYKSVSERQFKDSFIEGAEIYLDVDGIVALPVMVDPLVMFWNRSIFNDVRVTQPPKFWDEFYSLSGAVSKKDGALNISRSLVSFGEYKNVSNAKAIISTLMMQAGTPIVQRFGNTARSVMADPLGKPVIPGEAAVNFYTEFSNPSKPFYSWNRALPLSSTYFLSGDLALYLGFSSEIFDIQKKNPNLNFDVAPVPISRDSGENVSYAKFYALAISRGSRNPSAALSTASILSSAQGIAAFSEVLNLPPVRRDLLAQRPTDAYRSVFYDSAIRSKAWLDPDPEKSNGIFERMIEGITSGRERTSAAVVRAGRELTDLFK
jgi:ABC-type glycerol-3-phosphate transport system substrate-binding protein